jgi:antitoxin (DNA-binding transcriptional repressor) of toxin-antitoxin stability system
VVTNLVIFVYNEAVNTVKIAQLKAQLSAHLRLVQSGEELLVCDRQNPVARIVPVNVEDRSTQERRLVARGVLRPPLKKRSRGGSWSAPPGNISDSVWEQLWREEREGR